MAVISLEAMESVMGLNGGEFCYYNVEWKKLDQSSSAG